VLLELLSGRDDPELEPLCEPKGDSAPPVDDPLPETP
jgi:hypothetical protein